MLGIEYETFITNYECMNSRMHCDSLAVNHKLLDPIAHENRLSLDNFAFTDEMFNGYGGIYNEIFLDGGT